jgi:hypothetical protein
VQDVLGTPAGRSLAGFREREMTWIDARQEVTLEATHVVVHTVEERARYSGK